MPTHLPPQKGSRRIIGRVLALFILLSPGMFPVAGFATDILLGTEAVGTFSHFSGRAICRVINRHADGLNCQVIPAVDNIHNLTNLQGGSLDIALVDASMLYDAINKKGHFAFLDILYDNLASLTPVYNRAVTLVAREDAEIDSLDQLNGKRINAAPPRSRTRQVVDLILETKGLTYGDFKTVDALPTSLSQDSMAFCHGSVQAMVHIGVHPDSAMQKLINLCNAVPVDLDDAAITKLVQGHPAYSAVQIPEQAYPELGRSVSTFGITVSLVASGSLDDETVQTIMSVLDTQHKTLQHAHPAMNAFTVGQEFPDVGIAMHPGAAAYLSQQQ